MLTVQSVSAVLHTSLMVFFPLKLGLDTQLAMGMGHGGGHSPSPEDDEEEYDYDYDYNMVKLTIALYNKNEHDTWHNDEKR